MPRLSVVPILSGDMKIIERLKWNMRHSIGIIHRPEGIDAGLLEIRDKIVIPDARGAISVQLNVTLTEAIKFNSGDRRERSAKGMASEEERAIGTTSLGGLNVFQSGGPNRLPAIPEATMNLNLW